MTYVGRNCRVCNGRVRYKHNDLCVVCYPKKMKSQDERKRLKAIRERIEEHQHRHDNQL
jgi:hypothetical protein